MITEYSDDSSGAAVFSDDRRFRFLLRRTLQPESASRVVFLMLNPSTADAFKLDPTVRECCGRAWAWGYDMIDVVNLFAVRSPHPRDVFALRIGKRGDGLENDFAIVAACEGADLVIAAWGNHGNVGGRADHVVELLRARHVGLMCLGSTMDGSPKHPLARGVHRIPQSFAPVRWSSPRLEVAT